jgi:hypothetical protein
VPEFSGRIKSIQGRLWDVLDNDMKPQPGSSIAGPSLRGLWGRSATGQNGQVPKEKTRQYGGGPDAATILLASASGRSVFRLTSLFIGLIDWALGAFPAPCDGWQPDVDFLHFAKAKFRMAA